jgi:DUF1009 family protein
MATNNPPQLALVCGGGSLPALLAAGAAAQGYQVHVVTFEGQPQPHDFIEPPASRVVLPIGAVGRLIAHLKARRVSHVALAGNLNRPSLFGLRPDVHALKILARVRGFSDDLLLRACTDYLQAQGFVVLKVADLAPQLLAPKGVLTKTRPAGQDDADIALAVQTLATLGPLDVGQAAVVHHGMVLGLEAVEGTDVLVERCAALRGPLEKKRRAGILVKLPKPGQTDLADLPTVGPHTLTRLNQLHYRGVAVGAGGTLLLGLPELILSADTSGLFIVGLEP